MADKKKSEKRLVLLVFGLIIALVIAFTSMIFGINDLATASSSTAKPTEVIVKTKKTIKKEVPEALKTFESSLYTITEDCDKKYNIVAKMPKDQNIQLAAIEKAAIEAKRICKSVPSDIEKLEFKTKTNKKIEKKIKSIKSNMNNAYISLNLALMNLEVYSKTNSKEYLKPFKANSKMIQVCINDAGATLNQLKEELELVKQN